MTVLITGGLGYIGSKVSNRLPGARIIDHKAWNRIDKDTLDKLLPGCDSVIHLAGTKNAYSAHECYQDLFDFITLCRGMARHGVKRLVLCSSASVYGETSGVIDETVSPAPVTAYGRCKLIAEMIAKDFIKTVVVIRPFNASGGLAKFIPYVKNGTVTLYGDGEDVRDFVHVDDLADAFVKALESPSDTFNIGSGKGYSLNQIIAMKGNVKVEHMPPLPDSPKVLVADIAKARNKLGWSPKHTIEDILC